MWWFLAREVLNLRGKISRETGFYLDGLEVMPDLYFYRDPAEQEREEVQQIETVAEQSEAARPYEGPIDFSAQQEIKDWAAEAQAEWSQTIPGGGTGGDWNQSANNW